MQATISPSSDSFLAPTKPTELFDLPSEMRQIIIDHMDGKTMCIYSRCSRACRDDITDSTKWCDRLWYHNKPEKTTIDVFFKKEHVEDVLSKFGYQLRFEKGIKSKYCNCISSNGVLLWRKELGNEVDLKQHASDTFKSLLDRFKKSVQTISIGNWDNGNLRTELANLTNLKNLNISKYHNIHDYLAVFRKQLDSLFIKSDTSTQEISEYQQIYQVRENLYVDNVLLNLDQLRRLTAPIVTIPIGHLAANDLFLMIKDWKMGSWPSDPKMYTFDIRNSPFNTDHMLDIFAHPEKKGVMGAFRISHNSDPQKTTICYFDLQRVCFDFQA